MELLYKIFRLFLILLSRGLLLTLLMPAASCAKAWVADKLGDSTARLEGRMSMDFRRHTDRLGILAVLVFGFGWNKDMNIDVSRLKRMKLDVTLISLAAPAAYFIMYVLLYNISALLFGLSTSSFILACVYSILRRAGRSCLYFGIIALLPIPPLDGFHIFYQFSPPKFRRWYFTNYQKIAYWSNYVLLGIFLLDSITDGELSLLGFLGWLWRLLLDRLIFFSVDFTSVTEKILKIVFGYY